MWINLTQFNYVLEQKLYLMNLYSFKLLRGTYLISLKKLCGAKRINPGLNYPTY